jgi:hypothetical protein
MKIRTQADIVELEKVPLGERLRHGNVLEIIQDSGARYADRVAFRSSSRARHPMIRRATSPMPRC